MNLHLPTSRLGDHVEVLSGFAFKSERFNTDGSGLPLVRIRDVTRGYSDTFYDGPFDEQFVVSDGDLLVGMDGEFNRERWRGGRALLNQRVCRLLPKPGILDQNYLYHLLPGVLKKIQDATPFVTVKHLSVNELRAVQLVLPPLDEQRRIAAILDKADALRQKRKRAIALLDSLTQSVFKTVTTDAGAVVGPLSDALTFVTSGGRNWTQYIAEEGARFIRSFDVQSGSISDDDQVFVAAPDNAEAKRTRTHVGDVLLTITGSRIGRAAALPNDLVGAYVSQHVAILRVDQAKLLPAFLSAFLISEQGQAQIAKWQYGQTKPGLNFEQIRRFEIPMLPMAAQVEFVEQCETLAAHMRSLDRSAVVSDTLFASLQHRAFSGQL